MSQVSYISRGDGGDGGGYIGIAGYDETPIGSWITGRGGSHCGLGGTQTAGGKNGGGYNNLENLANGYFGHGGEHTPAIQCCGNSGGGAGWYGGGASLRGHGGGGGGSSYIGSSSLVSGAGVTKHMTCFDCTTSSDNNTKTNSNSNVSGTATADYSKSGNGYAKITYLGETL